MALTNLQTEIRQLAKFDKSVLAHLENGVRLERLTGKSIMDLVRVAASDRQKLAKSFLRSANKLLTSKPTQYRDVISRAYYSMYHGARAVAYLHNRGDDYQKHELICKNLPNDFPDKENWQNCLKDARFKRNEADYEFYPAGNTKFKTDGINLLRDAAGFEREAVQYLRRHGCNI